MRVMLLIALLATTKWLDSATASEDGAYLSPAALAATKDGRNVFVACATADRILRFDVSRHTVLDFVETPGAPSGLALSPDGHWLYATSAGVESKVCIVDVSRLKIVGTVAVGHTAVAPVPSPDGKMLYVCNRFNNSVSAIDLAARREIARLPVEREPVAADITKDGRFLLVANRLPSSRADAISVSAAVSVIDLAKQRTIKTLRLLQGSGSVNDLRISPDGKWAAVTHILARFKLPTTQVYQGWMNASALTPIDLERMDIHNTVLLDDPTNGLANPWGIVWSADATKLIVAHAGTHEISVIDLPLLLRELPSLSALMDDNPSSPAATERERVALSEDLAFVGAARRRVRLSTNDLGTRSVLIVNSLVCAANYYSDTLSLFRIDDSKLTVTSVALVPQREMTPIRKGELYFHDARLCFQGWQSCSTCHPDGRADGLNWDLLNDGVGNPKNTKSLLLAHSTPPAMALGVRRNAETAVRAGLKHILFADCQPEVATAIDEYLKSLRPLPSPYLVAGRFSESAERGRLIFAAAGCAECHSAGLFTDLHAHDVGTRNRFDRTAVKFDTPSLVELWRTAPYLHDGSATTVRDVVTIHNRRDRHGRTSNLSDSQINDLCAYLLSL